MFIDLNPDDCCPQNSLIYSYFDSVKCAIDHPHHVLPKVFALVNAFKDDIYIHDPRQKKKTVSSSPRTDAAINLLQRLKGDARLRDTIIQMERMCEGK